MSNEPLTVDDAMAEFSRLMDELTGAAPGLAPPERQTHEQADANCLRFAEHILSLLCPDPTACAEHRCRRQRQCRIFVEMRSLQPTHPRRPPGATALRYAVWTFMNAYRR